MKKVMAFTIALLVCACAFRSGGNTEIYAEEKISEEKVETVTEETGDSDTTQKDDTSEKTDDTVTEETEEIDENNWHQCLHEAADAELTTDGKTFTMVINNPGGEANGGADKWDVQFRCRGISIEEGHNYKLTYQISSSQDGYYYTKIGNLDAKTVGAANSGEVWHNQFGVSTIESYVEGLIKRNKGINYAEGWTMQRITKGDTISVTSTFDGIATIPEAEWVFFLGGEGPATPGGCFKEGTVLMFTNLTLVDLTTGEEIISYGKFVDSELKGDLDGNGVVELTDLTMLSLYLVGDTQLDNAQISNADLTGDGLVNLADLPCLKEMIMAGSK